VKAPAAFACSSQAQQQPGGISHLFQQFKTAYLPSQTAHFALSGPWCPASALLSAAAASVATEVQVSPLPNVTNAQAASKQHTAQGVFAWHQLLWFMLQLHWSRHPVQQVAAYAQQHMSSKCITSAQLVS
jgi:hypothetical protein